MALQVVTKQINHWDPMSLLAGGAPDDEYEGEIDQIVDAVLVNKDEIVTAQAIKDIFDDSFGRSFPFDSCLAVAKSIWQELYF